jgi:hypothetical protein
MAENSLGTLPAIGLRLCSVVFLVCWMATLIAVSESLLSPHILRGQASRAESGLVAGGILSFAFFTGLQSPTVSARLAFFSNKLGVAILLAALIRVRDGWPAISTGFPITQSGSLIASEWHGLARLSFYIAPLAFLGANNAHRFRQRKQVASIAVLGFLLPLFGTLFVVGTIDVATGASAAYQPSLNPSVAMALWAHVASRALPGRMMLTAITTFGVARFGAKALAESTSMLAPGRRARWVVLGCGLLVIAWLSVQDAPDFLLPFEWSVTGLAVASAVLTADYVAVATRVENVRRVDWTATIALLAGWTATLYMPKWIAGTDADQWWHPRLLPSYAVGFLVCLLGRIIQKQFPKAA